MKWTMTIDEMQVLFNLNLYVLGWHDEEKWGNIARPNMRYCKADAPVFEWHERERVWHFVSTPSKMRKEMANETHSIG